MLSAVSDIKFATDACDLTLDFFLLSTILPFLLLSNTVIWFYLLFSESAYSSVSIGTPIE